MQFYVRMTDSQENYHQHPKAKASVWTKKWTNNVFPLRVTFASFCMNVWFWDEAILHLLVLIPELWKKNQVVSNAPMTSHIKRNML